MPAKKKYLTEEERKAAIAANQKAYRLRNLERVQERDRNIYYKKRELRLAQMREWYAQNRHLRLEDAHQRFAALTKEEKQRRKDNSDPIRFLLKCAKYNANRKGYEYNITYDDIVIPERCPYLDCKITRIAAEGRVSSNASIDRIESSKGYITGNVQVISSKANTMKNSASIEELVTFAKGVLRLHAGIDVDSLSSECRELQQVPTLHKN